MLLHTSNGGYTSVPGTYQSAGTTPELTLFPNPCKEETHIQYELPVGAKVSVRVFSISGREVFALDKGFQSRGKYQVSFSAANLPAGVYFCHIQADGKVETKKMVVTR
jgi:hypothetical protein